MFFSGPRKSAVEFLRILHGALRLASALTLLYHVMCIPPRAHLGMLNEHNHMKGQSFSERVVKLARSVPRGRVTTYGDLARAAGAPPMAAQSITSILSKAERAGVRDIPFHRIVYAGGRIWINDEHRRARMELYAREGIEIDERGRVVDFERIRV